MVALVSNGFPFVFDTSVFNNFYYYFIFLFRIVFNIVSLLVKKSTLINSALMNYFGTVKIITNSVINEFWLIFEKLYEALDVVCKVEYT